MRLANPFYHNYVFSHADLARCTLSRWQLFWLRFVPTSTQFTEGEVFHDTRWSGKGSLIKTEPLHDP